MRLLPLAAFLLTLALAPAFAQPAANLDAPGRDAVVPRLADELEASFVEASGAVAQIVHSS